MSKKINKILAVLLLAFVTVSFSGCLNLSKKGEKEGKEVVANNHQGVFKSTDGGKTWEQRVKIEGGGLIDGVKISIMVMDPNDNNILYLGTLNSGLYKSENGADSWKKITDENNILSETIAINDIAIEKGNSNIIYLATLNNGKGELLKSEDGGKSWNKSHIIAQAGKAVTAVEIDPIYSNVVYLGTEEIQGGFLKSENKGEDWVSLYWFNAKIEDILIDFRNSQGIIVKLSNNIFKSVDGGIKWESLAKTGVDFAKISSLTMDSRNPLILYINYLNLILKTEDGGETWKKLNTLTPSKTAVGTIPQIKQIGIINNIVYYGAGNVLYKSDNRGVSWSSYDILIKGDVRYTVSDYTNQDVIYVGSFYTPPPPPKKKKNPLFPF
ncbi:MAG: YCF48-related protein [Patescibacteria group bacterium]|nr:YCF48-related protein [Patescibacteria group bacterium]